MKTQSSRLFDSDIRPVLRCELEEKYRHDSIIREEFGCKGARVDLAVVNGRLHGFEIKSDRDSLDRLVTQVPVYNALFDSMTIVVGTKHLNAIGACVPRWWGIWSAKEIDGKIILKRVRAAENNKDVDPASLVGLLWRKETWSILRKHDQHSGLRFASAFTLQQALVERVPFDALAGEVRNAIKIRLRFEVAEPRPQSDDSCTTESIAADYRMTYQTNLNWLLSLRSRDRRY